MPAKLVLHYVVFIWRFLNILEWLGWVGAWKKWNQITNSVLIHALHKIEKAVQLIILKNIICKYINISFSLFMKSDSFFFFIVIFASVIDQDVYKSLRSVFFLKN